MTLKKTNIENFTTYNKRMAMSILDKMYFLDKVDADIFIDYGCSDGSLIKHIYNFLPTETKFFGFDINPKMITSAIKNTNGIDVQYFSDWNLLLKKLKNKNIYKNKKTCLVLSSLIHEIYSYSTSTDEIYNFWETIFNSEIEFDFICIRDMMVSKTIDRPAEINDTLKVYKNIKENLVLSFENIWGTIENNKNLIHLLLKYRYEDDWKRENNENYFSLLYEDFLKIISKWSDKYSVIFKEHFILPFIKSTVYSDVGIELKDKTHIKIIFQKGNNNERN